MSSNYAETDRTLDVLKKEIDATNSRMDSMMVQIVARGGGLNQLIQNTLNVETKPGADTHTASHGMSTPTTANNKIASPTCSVWLTAIPQRPLPEPSRPQQQGSMPQLQLSLGDGPAPKPEQQQQRVQLGLPPQCTICSSSTSSKISSWRSNSRRPSCRIMG